MYDEHTSGAPIFENGAKTSSFAYLFSSAGTSVAQGGLSGLGRAALDVAGKIWALPNTIIGFAAGMAGIPFGGDWPTIGNNAIQFLNYPWGHDAITLGNVQIYVDYGPKANLQLYDSLVPLNVGLHEEAHTYQSQVLGPLFFPVYGASGGISSTNPLEHAANNYASGGGWWPW